MFGCYVGATIFEIITNYTNRTIQSASKKCATAKIKITTFQYENCLTTKPAVTKKKQVKSGKQFAIYFFENFEQLITSITLPIVVMFH